MEIYLFWIIVLFLILFVISGRFLKNKNHKYLFYFNKFGKYLGILLLIIFLFGILVGTYIGFPN